MDRRTAIQKLIVLSGGVLIAPDVLKAWNNPVVHNKIFSRPDVALLAELAEVIIPTTDTPGAKEAGVAEFIEKIVADCFRKDKALEFQAGLKNFDELSAKQLGVNFVDADSDDKMKATLAAAQRAKNHLTKNDEFLLTMKSLTVAGYFTSEIGCTQALRYDMAPGKYVVDYPYKKGDKAWAD